MPGIRCAVAACNNIRAKTMQISDNIKYFRFPRDDIMRQLWTIKCQPAGKLNPHTATICSIHFSADDYERDLQAELLGTKPKRILKKTAIPSLFVDEDWIDKSPQETKPSIMELPSPTEPNANKTDENVELPTSSELEENWHAKLEKLLNDMDQDSLENVSKNIESIKMQLKLLKAAGAELSFN